MTGDQLDILNLLQNGDRILLPTRRHGLYYGVVEDNADPEGLGRLRIRVPQIHTDASKIPTNTLPWAIYCSPFGGGAGFGFYMIPPVNSQVVVAFVQGDSRFPVWLGTAWRKAQAPSEATGVKVNEIKTPGGHKIILDDTSGSLKILIQTIGGDKLQLDDTNNKVTLQSAAGHKVEMDDTAGKIVAQSVAGKKVTIDDTIGKVELDATGGNLLTLSLTPPNLIITAAGIVNETYLGAWTVNVTGNIILTASGTVTITGGTVTTIAGATVNIGPGSVVNVGAGGTVNLG